MAGSDSPPLFTVAIHAVSAVGKVREHNEDCILVGELVFRDNGYSGELRCDADTVWCAAVADGMGGAAAGEVASAMALQAFLTGVSELSPAMTDDQIRATVPGLCVRAHQQITEEADRDPSKHGMGTTLAAVLTVGGRWYRVHAGDSRVYRLRHRLLKQLTRDHSLREQTGDPTAPANVVTNAIGGADSCYCDIDLLSERISAGDVFLISSDGLHDYVSADDIEDTLVSDPQPVDRLISCAYEAGAPDNVSVILLEFADG